MCVNACGCSSVWVRKRIRGSEHTDSNPGLIQCLNFLSLRGWQVTSGSTKSCCSCSVSGLVRCSRHYRYTYFCLACNLKMRQKCASLCVRWAEVSMTCTVVGPTAADNKLELSLHCNALTTFQNFQSHMIAVLLALHNFLPREEEHTTWLISAITDLTLDLSCLSQPSCPSADLQKKTKKRKQQNMGWETRKLGQQV